jgi:PKD repeat protein
MRWIYWISIFLLIISVPSTMAATGTLDTGTIHGGSGTSGNPWTIEFNQIYWFHGTPGHEQYGGWGVGNPSGTNVDTSGGSGNWAYPGWMYWRQQDVGYIGEVGRCYINLYGGGQDDGYYIFPVGGSYNISINFTANVTSGISSLPIKFTDTSTRTPTTWAWDVNNDGTTDYTTQNCNHTYSFPGTYSVKLTVSNAYSTNTTTKTDYITVYDPGPIPDFTGNITSGNASLFVHFTDASTGSPTSWSWNYGDGLYSTTQNPTHEYTTPGTYSVSLTVENTNGTNTKTRSGYITVYPPIFNLEDISIDGFLTDAVYRDHLNAFTVKIVKGYVNAQGNFIVLDDPIYVTTNGLDPNTGYYAKYDLPAGEVL